MTATEHIDPTKAVGRLLHPEGWRVERTFAYEGGVMLCGGEMSLGGYSMPSAVKQVPHGERVEVVIEAIPADDVTGDARQAVQ